MCNLFHSAKIIYNLNLNFLQVVRMNIAIFKNLFTYFSDKSSKQQSWWQSMQSLKLFSKLSSKYLLAFVDFAQIQRIICYLIQIYFLVIDILSPTQICFEKISNLLITPTSLNLLSTNDTWQFNPRIPHHFISV